MFFTAIHDDALLVVYAMKMLVTDSKVGRFDVARHHNSFCRATLLVHNIGQRVGTSAILQHHGEEGVVVGGRQYLDVGGVAVRQHLVYLAALVPSTVFHNWPIGHLVAVVIHLRHIHLGATHVIAVRLLELHV